MMKNFVLVCVFCVLLCSVTADDPVEESDLVNSAPVESNVEVQEDGLNVTVVENNATNETVATETVATNETQVNGTEVGEVSRNNKTTKPVKVDCKIRELLPDASPAVMVVNSTVMLSVVVPESNLTANECALVLFYAPWCHFSALAAPHFNALARIYPSFHLFAVNAIKYSSLNTRYGIVAVPTLLLFHNGRAVAKFNETTYSLEHFVEFLDKYTNSQPEGALNVTSADFYGPLPSETVNEPDYVLWLAWIFIIICTSLAFVKSSFCNRIVEIIRNNWNEAEAQHEHID